MPQALQFRYHRTQGFLSLNSGGTIEDSLRVRHNRKHMPSKESGQLDGMKIAFIGFFERSQELRARVSWLAKHIGPG